MQKLFVLILLNFVLGGFVLAQNSANAVTDTVMVLPFENTSSKSEFNWVGESVADSLTDLLKVPGLNVISNEERKIMQQRMKIPLSVLPSLATSLKMARQGNASLLVAGKYNIVPANDDVAAKITINAKLIRVEEGRFLSEEFPDGSRKTREIDLFDALGNLQTIQGQLAYQILYQRDKALPFSQNQFIEAANKVPAKAFEAYIKGLLTDVGDTRLRENYFKNAIRIYAAERGGDIYAEAALELGHIFYDTGKNAEAIANFARIPQDNSHYAEGAFYTGVIYWKRKNYEQAISVLGPLAEDLQMTSVLNTVGAIAVQASISTKDPKKSAKFMVDGTGFLKKSSESSGEDTESHFNLGLALMLQKKYAEAAKVIRLVLANDPRDGEAHFLLAKSLEKTGDPSAVDFDNQARRFLTGNNQYATLESAWKKNSLKGIDLRVNQPTRREFVSVVLVKNRNVSPVRTPENETVVLLRNASELYRVGRDDDAMVVLRRILVQEPMSAESYLLLGKIHFRRGDIEQAVSSLKTALFWKNQLIEAHILLGRIYVQKGDCLQAQNYSKSALAIDSDDQNALGLERQVERCSK
ncbi:MAG: tetratricopeptide repeat protein [Pyrinomonadaceae bacterium]|nr:tetratricopeptide repeat protein [Pyrinomonadaceae bacterium]